MKKKILSAVLALAMVMTMPMATVLADEVVQTDDVTGGQESSIFETSNIENDVTENNEYQETTAYAEIVPLANNTDISTSGQCGDNAYWSFENGTLTISGTGDMYDYAYDPNSGVTPTPWLMTYFSDIKSVIIEDGITHIGSFAFTGCINLTDVKLPDSINSVNGFAFCGCTNLKSIKLPPNIKIIPYECFDGCKNLESIVIPDSVTEILSLAFYRSGLKSITLPKSVTSIFDEAFSECNSLTDVYYAGSKSDWEAISIDAGNEALLNATIHYNGIGPDELITKNISGVLRNGEGCRVLWQCSYQTDSSNMPQNAKIKIFTSSIDGEKEELFLYNESAENVFPMPWELEPYNIPKSAVTEIDIDGEPSKLLRICESTFQNYTNLKRVSLDCVSGIEPYSFDGCISLKEAYMPDMTLVSIGERAFRNCSKLCNIITIGEETTKIGAGAFEGCNNIVIRCYPQSVAHKYAEENGIKFELIDPPKEKILLPFYSGMSEEITYWDIDWSWDLFNLPSTKYDSRLAAFGAALSSATEVGKYEASSVLNELNFDKIKSCSYDTGGLYSPAVTFAYKKVEGTSEHILVVAVRGSTATGDFVTDVLPFGFDISKMHTAFDLGEFMKECGIKDADIKNNGKIYITGHSLGGAVSNLLAKDLTDKFGVNRVYSYTFASPKTSNSNNASGYLNIHNIANDEDDVRKMGAGSTRYGINYRAFSFYVMKNDPSFCGTFERLTGKGIWHINPIFFLGMHHVEIYAAYAFGGYNPQTNTQNGKIIKVKCPVDVKIYNSNNQLLGKIINNVCSDAIYDDMIYFYVEDNAKYIDIVDDGDYTIKLTGTDTGTMEYSVLEVNMGTNETVAEKNFKNVSLSNGKKFTSYVSVWDKTDLTINSSEKVDTPEINLYVIDDNGTPENEVLPDGNGTEVPINNDNTPTTPDTPSKPTVPDNGESTSNTNTSTVAPFGGTNTESLTVIVENKVTGKTSKARGQKTGSSVAIKLGTENNGYYANVYTTDDEYVCSALIENGRAKFTVQGDVKLKIVIDSIAYGEDVSSAAGSSADNEPDSTPYPVIITLIAVLGIYFKSGKMHFYQKTKS